jgi:hypothetical protein
LATGTESSAIDRCIPGKIALAVNTTVSLMIPPAKI